MLGAIIGDMVGSLYEFKPIKTKSFRIIDKRMRMTDDSLLTLAVAKTLMDNYPIKYDEESLKKIQKDLTKEFVRTWNAHRGAGWGGMFFQWCHTAYATGEAKPYNSYGNGSAMRISPVAWVAKSEEELKLLSKTVTEITHNHPEGIKGAEAVAMCIYLALHGASKREIRNRMVKDYYPEINDFDFDDLVKNYEFSEICQKSVPQAIYCFLHSHDLEDAIRNCIAIGGDCDTTGAMAGAIAEAYYSRNGLSRFEKNFLYFMIDHDDEEFIKKFHKTVGSKKFEPTPMVTAVLSNGLSVRIPLENYRETLKKMEENIKRHNRDKALGKKYLSTDNKSIIFLCTNNKDFLVAKRDGYHNKWIEVDVDETPYPTKSDIEISEEEALEIAKNYGMSEEAFFEIDKILDKIYEQESK